MIQIRLRPLLSIAPHVVAGLQGNEVVPNEPDPWFLAVIQVPGVGGCNNLLVEKQGLGNAAPETLGTVQGDKTIARIEEREQCGPSEGRLDDMNPRIAFGNRSDFFPQLAGCFRMTDF